MLGPVGMGLPGKEIEMAKSKQSKKGKRNGSKANGSRQLVVASKQLAAPRPGFADARVRSHVNMVVDPCNAPLGPTAYRGADGFITRFKGIYPVTVSAATPYYLFIYYPAYNSVWAQPVGNINEALAPAYAVQGPGQPFLLTNADSQRVVSACTTFRFAGSELNRQGIVYRGNLPQVATVGASLQQLMTLCQCVDRMPDGQLDTKWNPSPAEEEYWSTGPAAPDAGGDRNVIVTIVQGSSVVDMPISLTVTLISEWRPRFGIGMQVPTPSTADAPAGLERVRTALSTFGNWWATGSSIAAQAITTGARMYKASKMVRASIGLAALTL